MASSSHGVALLSLLGKTNRLKYNITRCHEDSKLHAFLTSTMDIRDGLL
jgi:hypothetical protein